MVSGTIPRLGLRLGSQSLLHTVRSRFAQRKVTLPLIMCLVGILNFCVCKSLDFVDANLHAMNYGFSVLVVYGFLVVLAFTGEKETIPVAMEKKRKAADSLTTTAENISSAEPVAVESDQPAKVEVSSPKLENKPKSNADLFEPSGDAGVQEVACGGPMEVQEKKVNQEDSKPLLDELSGLGGVAKPTSLEDQFSSASKLDFDMQESVATKG